MTLIKSTQLDNIPISKITGLGSVVINNNGNLVYNGYTYYDQQTAPTSPSIGDRWTERDSNNGVVLDWFWNGVVWLSSHLFTVGVNSGIFQLALNPDYNVYVVKIVNLYLPSGSPGAPGVYNVLSITLADDYGTNNTLIATWNDSVSALSSYPGTLTVPVNTLIETYINGDTLSTFTLNVVAYNNFANFTPYIFWRSARR